MPNELIALDDESDSGSPRKKVPGWSVAVAGIAVVLVFATTSTRSDPGLTATTRPAAEIPFSGSDAAVLGELWWTAVLDGDVEAALAVMHSTANSFDLARFARAAGDPVSVSIESVPLGSPTQPQLCYLVLTARAQLTGALVFRPEGQRWLIWEVRPDTERCSRPTVATEPTRPEPLISSFAVELGIPLRLLAVEPGVTNLVVFDFDTSLMTSYSSRAHVISGIAGAAITPDRSLLAWSSSIYLFDGRLNEIDLVIEPSYRDTEPPFSHSGLDVIPDPDDELIWVIQPGVGYGPEPEPTIVELRSMETGNRLRYFEMDGNRFPVAAMESALVINGERLFDTGNGWITEPGSETVSVLLESGIDAPVGSGRAIAAFEDVIVRLACPADQAACDLFRTNELIVTTTEGSGFVDRSIPRPIEGTWMSTGGPLITGDWRPLPSISADGSAFLIRIGRDLDVNGSPSASSLVVVNLADGTTRVIAEFRSMVPIATWSSDGRWIVLIDGNDVQLIDVKDLENILSFPDLIPEDHFVVAAG